MLHEILVIYPDAVDFTVFFFRYEVVAERLICFLMLPFFMLVTVTGVVTWVDSSLVDWFPPEQANSPMMQIIPVKNGILFISGSSFG